MSYAPVAMASTAAFAPMSHAYEQLGSQTSHGGPRSLSSGHGGPRSLSSGHGHSPLPSPDHRPMSGSEQSSGGFGLAYMGPGGSSAHSHSAPSEAYGPEWLASRPAPSIRSAGPVAISNPDPASPVDAPSPSARQSSSDSESGFFAMGGGAGGGSRKAGETFAVPEHHEDAPPAYEGASQPAGPSARRG